MKIGKIEIDRALAASIALHVGVLGWGLVSFSTRALDAKPQESMPVDVISSEQLSQITRGTKTGQKENPKALVEKVGDPKPVDEAIGKVTEKKEIVAASDKPPEPKPPEKKPEPPKPVETKPEPPVDQIAEALKKDQAKKPVEKKETKSEPKKDEKPKKERTFDASKVAALIDKRDATRQAVTGDVLNTKRSIGTAAGQAQKLTFGWLGALRARLKECWHVPAGVRDADSLEIRVAFALRRDGRLVGPPHLMAAPPMANGPAVAESALRAVQQCQPYDFLPQSEYEGGWNELDVTFNTNDLFR